MGSVYAYMCRYLMVCVLGLGSFFPLHAQRSEAEFRAMLEDLYQKTVPLIEVSDVQAHAFTVLDTRTRAEFEVAHIPGAIWVGYESFQGQVVAGLDKDRPILLYCSVGYRSERIGERLLAQGFTQVYNLYGGVFAWKNQGRPLWDAAGQPTQRVHTYNREWSQWVGGEKVYE